jgi:hypothetical protein
MAKAKSVVLVPLAKLELEQARLWYENQRQGLGYEFLTEVDAAIGRIRESPQMYPKLRKNYRQIILNRFPYALYYEFAASTITVYTVFHCSQDPVRLDDRLP